MLQRCRSFIPSCSQQKWIKRHPNETNIPICVVKSEEAFEEAYLRTCTLSPITTRRLVGSVSSAVSTTVIYHQNPHSYLPRVLEDNVHSLQSRCFAQDSRGNRNRDPDMRNCKSIKELFDVAYEHKDMMSPRGMAAFWTLVSKLLKRRGGPTPKHEQMHVQLDELIGQTLQSIDTYGYRDIATVAISLAKCGNSIGSHQTILRDVLIGDNSDNKQFIFNEIAYASVSIIHEFDARHLSNLIYAFGLAEVIIPVEDGSTFFDSLADVAIPMLHQFNGQDLSNMLWAYANVGESYPRLFKKVADHIVSLRDLRQFKPQELKDIVWAFATAKESHPNLFTNVANHIISLDNLNDFKPQEFSNTVWAFATAKESHPALFQKLSDAAIKRQNEFTEQGIANFLWAYATNGQIDRNLFSSLVPTVEAYLDKCNAQDLANIAWAYTVANVDAPAVFNDEFINACIEKEDGFSFENLAQLHQWQLWQEELNSNVSLPPSLQKKCYDAFVSRVPRPSKLQDDVISQLSSMDLELEEEVLTKSGYRIDGLVDVNGKKIGVEVDGPTHFIGRNPSGSTILKHRQVSNLDETPVVSVPYWDWNKLGKDSEKKQQYLHLLLS